MREKLWTLWGEIKKRATVFVRESAKCVEVHAEKWSMDGRKRNCLCTEVLHQKNLLVSAEGTSEKTLVVLVRKIIKPSGVTACVSEMY